MSRKKVRLLVRYGGPRGAAQASREGSGFWWAALALAAVAIALFLRR